MYNVQASFPAKHTASPFNAWRPILADWFQGKRCTCMGENMAIHILILTHIKSNNSYSALNNRNTQHLLCLSFFSFFPILSLAFLEKSSHLIWFTPSPHLIPSTNPNKWFISGTANSQHACYKWHVQPLCLAHGRSSRKEKEQSSRLEREERAE